MRRAFRNFATSALLMAVLTTPAAAQQGHMGTQEQQRACQRDALRFCRDAHDDYATANCLRANMHKLRPACRDVLEGRR